MNKQELINKVAEATEMTKKDAKVVVETVFGTIADELAEGGSVSVAGFGKFAVVEVAARNGVNPSTGEPMVIEAHNKVKFSVSSTLKNAVR